MVCGKMLKGAYGNWGNHGWTCSAKCERVQEERPLYPGHSEADYFKRLGEHHAALFPAQTGEAQHELSPVLRGSLPVEIQSREAANAP